MMETDKRRSNSLVVCAVAAVFMLGSAYLFSDKSDEPAGGKHEPHLAPASAVKGSAEAPAAIALSGDSGVARPADIDPTEWHRLVDALRLHPQRDQELKRMIGYMRFARDVDQWRALDNQPNARERAQIGQRILNALPERLANREVSGPEALMLQAAVYADLIPDDVQRTIAENAAREALRRVIEQSETSDSSLVAEVAQLASYKQREAAITARFRSGHISQEQMEKELDAARVEVFR